MTGFNWYNNGWYMNPETKTTCLRISNGAKFEIPFGPLVYDGGEEGILSNSIEISFKVRNVQKYGNLITNITRYNGDEQYYADYLDQDDYDNYDAYLQATLDAYTYEQLTFSRV